MLDLHQEMMEEIVCVYMMLSFPFKTTRCVYRLGSAQSSATAVRLKPAKSGASGSFSAPPVAGSVCAGSGAQPQKSQRSAAPTLQYVPAWGHWSLLPHAGMTVPYITPAATRLCSATIATPVSMPQTRWSASASSGARAQKKTLALGCDPPAPSGPPGRSLEAYRL